MLVAARVGKFFAGAVLADVVCKAESQEQVGCCYGGVSRMLHRVGQISYQSQCNVSLHWIVIGQMCLGTFVCDCSTVFVHIEV